MHSADNCLFLPISHVQQAMLGDFTQVDLFT